MSIYSIDSKRKFLTIYITENPFKEPLLIWCNPCVLTVYQPDKYVLILALYEYCFLVLPCLIHSESSSLLCNAYILIRGTFPLSDISASDVCGLLKNIKWKDSSTENILSHIFIDEESWALKDLSGLVFLLHGFYLCLVQGDQCW
jgi:hypothetical protein